MRAGRAVIASTVATFAVLANSSACNGSSGAGGASATVVTSAPAASTQDAISSVGSSGGGGEGGGGGTGGTGPTSFVYVESNDPTANQNSVFGFSRAADGSLTVLPTGPAYFTGGSGLANPTQALGPNDSDQNFAASPTGHLVFAVNSGSDTIAALVRNANGALSPVPGSPFSSGGKGPVSLGLAGNRLYVVNRGREPGDVPNYTGFDVANTGILTPIANSTVALPVGASPAQALPAGNNGLLFGTDFMGPIATPAEGALRAFSIGSDGLLTNAPGSPFAIPASTAIPPKPAFALGLAVHPTQSILYTGFVTYAQVGVYTYGNDGALTFKAAADNSGSAVCWMRVNADGTFLYTVNSGSATISRYSLTDPLAPTETDHLLLKKAESGTAFVDGNGVTQTITSAPFQFEISHDKKNMYVVSQRVTTNAADTSGNFLHTLDIAADGSLSEPADPIVLAVPITARPQGILQTDE